MSANDPRYSVRHSPTEGDSIIVRWADGRAVRITFDDAELRGQVDDFLDEGVNGNGEEVDDPDAMVDSVLAVLFREAGSR